MDVINSKIFVQSKKQAWYKVDKVHCVRVNIHLIHISYIYIYIKTKHVITMHIYSLEYNCLCDLWRVGPGNFMQFQMSPSGLSKANTMDLLGCWSMRSNRISSDRKHHHHPSPWKKQQSTCKCAPVSNTEIEKSATHSFYGHRICQVSSRMSFPTASLTAGKGDTDRCIDGIRKNAQLWRLHQCWFIEAVICGDALRTNFISSITFCIATWSDNKEYMYVSWCISSVGPLIYLYISSASKPALAGCTESASAKIAQGQMW